MSWSLGATRKFRRRVRDKELPRGQADGAGAGGAWFVCLAENGSVLRPGRETAQAPASPLGAAQQRYLRGRKASTAEEGGSNSWTKGTQVTGLTAKL